MIQLTPADFKLDFHCWRTTVRLASWEGFQSRRGRYGALDSVAQSDGTVDVVFAPEGRNDAPLSESEVELVRWALQHQSEMQRSLLTTLLTEYPNMRASYSSIFADERLMPPVEDVDAFRELMGLHCLHVHQIEKGGFPYVGFEFGCTWDGEHGLGVLMHGTRVVEIGGADTAILLWIAERDASNG